MTAAQARKVEKKLNRIRTLAEEASAVFGDDAMEGDLYTALNNVTSAADWGLDVIGRRTA